LIIILPLGRKSDIRALHAIDRRRHGDVRDVSREDRHRRAIRESGSEAIERTGLDAAEQSLMRRITECPVHR
jgi:hypothetical protein